MYIAIATAAAAATVSPAIAGIFVVFFYVILRHKNIFIEFHTTLVKHTKRVLAKPSVKIQICGGFLSPPLALSSSSCSFCFSENE